MLSCFLLSVSLALFSTSIMVKIFLIDVERYEPLKLRLTVIGQLRLPLNPLKQRERMRKR